MSKLGNVLLQTGNAEYDDGVLRLSENQEEPVSYFYRGLGFIITALFLIMGLDSFVF